MEYGWRLGRPIKTFAIKAALLAACLFFTLAAAQGLAQPPPAASAMVPVEVPAGMAAGLFNEPRQLKVPPGFFIGVFARIPKARFMAVAPNGDLLVTTPSHGQITLLRPNGNPALRFPVLAKMTAAQKS